MKNFNDLVGLAVVGFVEDRYVVELDVEARHFNPNGIVHGGVICTLLDSAMSRAFLMTLPPEQRTWASLEMKVNFIKPTVSGKLTAFGELTHATRRTALVGCEVKNEEGKLVAKASGTMMLTDKT